MNTRESYAELQEKILGARRVWRRGLFWTGAAIVLTGLLAIVVGESIVDWLMPLPSPVRIALLAGIVIAVGYLLYRHLIQPLRASLTLRDVALNVERHHPSLEDRLVSAVQFGNREPNDAIEAHMLQRLLEDTTESVKGIDFKATVDSIRTRKHVGIALLVLAACALLSLLFPSEIQTSLLRVLVPWEKTEPILTTKLTVTPGNARILRGKSLPIHVTVTGKSADKVVLTYTSPAPLQGTPTPTVGRTSGPDNVEINNVDFGLRKGTSSHQPPVRTPREQQKNAMRTTEKQINMVQNAEDKRGFTYEIFNIDADMEYAVQANEATSARYTVEVFEMPRVTDIAVAYTYPEYTALKSVVQQGTGDIHAVVGTRAEIRLTTNKAIQTATFTVKNHIKKVDIDNVDGGTTQRDVNVPINLSERHANDRKMVISDGNILTTTVDVTQDGTYAVELLCIDGFNNEIPIEYKIRAVPDNAPEVVIKEPGRDVKATKLEEVQIIAEAKDDYGVEKLSLMYRIGAGDLQELAPAVGGTSGPDNVEIDNVDFGLRKGTSSHQPPVRTPREQQKNAMRTTENTYTFYMEEFDVAPGEVISYYAQATDNNTLTGPGEASSEIYFIEVRPFNERFQEEDGEQGEPAPPTPNIILELIATQKQIIRETWKHINAAPAAVTERFNVGGTSGPDTEEYPQDYQTAVKKTGEKQSEIAAQTQRFVDEISMAMQTAAVAPEILMNLEDAVDRMREASERLNAVQPTEAMPAEQEALELLIKVSIELPKVLTQMRDSNAQAAENLELEMEELQSEMEQDRNELEQEMREQTQEMLEQAREMLEEQQQLNQQSQQLGRENQPSPSEMQQNSQQQGQLSEQAQQMAQQLGQMQGSRQDSGQSSSQSTQSQRTNAQLTQAGQAMQQAGEQMQQASRGMQQQEPQQSAAKGEQAAARLEEAIEQLERVAAELSDDALEDAAQALQQMTEEQSEVQQQTQELRNRAAQNVGGTSGPDSAMQPEDFRQASDLANQQRELQRDLESLEGALQQLQEQLNAENPEASRNVADATNRLTEEQTASDMATAQRALQWRNFRAADQNQQAVLEALEQAQADLQQARANMATTEEEQLEAALEQLQSMEEQMQDIQRELQAMEEQEDSPAHEDTERMPQAIKNLAEQQQQLQERMQQAQQAMQGQNGQDGQDGQDDAENQQEGRAGAESNREIEELWLGLLDTMQHRPSNRSRPFPKYEFAIRDLRKLEAALEERLNTLQEKKRLSQVAKEDVPPEYRRLVDNYYESLSQ